MRMTRRTAIQRIAGSAAGLYSARYLFGCIPASGGGSGLTVPGDGGGGSNGDRNGGDGDGRDDDLLAFEFGVDNLQGDPIQGNVEQPNFLIEYSDFQCPFCRDFFLGEFQRIRAEYIEGGKLAFVYRHFPLSAIHENAVAAAEAAECYKAQNMDFFSYHDMLFENQDNGLSAADLQRYAEELGEPLGDFFNADEFEQCRVERDTQARVERDIESGIALGVFSTPTLFLNGELFEGRDYDDFEAVLGPPF